MLDIVKRHSQKSDHRREDQWIEQYAPNKRFFKGDIVYALPHGKEQEYKTAIENDYGVLASADIACFELLSFTTRNISLKPDDTERDSSLLLHSQQCEFPWLQLYELFQLDAGSTLRDSPLVHVVLILAIIIATIQVSLCLTVIHTVSLIRMFYQRCSSVCFRTM
jgi:hypothetical protein